MTLLANYPREKRAGYQRLGQLYPGEMLAMYQNEMLARFQTIEQLYPNEVLTNYQLIDLHAVGHAPLRHSSYPSGED